MDRLEDGCKAGIVIQAIDFLRKDPAFKITDKYEVSKRDKVGDSKKIRVPYGMTYKAKITCHAIQRGHYKVPLIITFYHDLNSNSVTEENGHERFELSHMAVEVLLIDHAFVLSAYSALILLILFNFIHCNLHFLPLDLEPDSL